MLSRYCTAAIAPLLGGLLLSLSAMAPAGAAANAVAPASQDLNALVLTAEVAFKRGDCGRATAHYTTAEQGLADTRLAARATAVALECGQYAAAVRAATRWRVLAASDPGPILGQIRGELGQFRIEPARVAFEELLKTGVLQSSRSRADTTGRQRTGGEGEAVGEHLNELAGQAGVPATLAMLRGVHSPVLQSGPAQLALAALALDGWNYREALQYGQSAATLGADRAAVQNLLAKAYAGLGEAEPALAAANAARTAAPSEQAFASADVLMQLGRDREAREALEVLRDNPQQHAQAQRRLGMLAFARGDYDEAKSDFTELLSDGNSNAAAVFYLSAIAERANDIDAAVRGYELLDGTALGAAGRSRAANLLYKQGQHEAALALLQPSATATPSQRLEAELARAQLLANADEPDRALARIDDALSRYPDHPDLLYQRAVMLERAGRVDAAIAQLEGLYKARPQDAAVSNALGYTLTDHKRELGRADTLIHSALAIEPDNPAILDSLGWLDFRRGAARNALPLFERAYRLDPDGDIGAHWGETLWSLGDKVKAREVWNRALISDPDNALVRAAQRRVGAPQLPTTGTGTSI